MKKSILFLLVFMTAALFTFGQKVSDATMGTYNNTYIKPGIDGGIRANSHNTFNKYIIASKAHKDSLDNVYSLGDTALVIIYKGVADTVPLTVVEELNDLSDVNLNTPDASDILMLDDETQKWVNYPFSNLIGDINDSLPNYWYLDGDTIKTIYNVVVDSSFYMLFDSTYLGYSTAPMAVETGFDRGALMSYNYGDSATFVAVGYAPGDKNYSSYMYSGKQDANELSRPQAFVITQYDAHDESTRVTLSASDPTTKEARITLFPGSTVINGQVFVPDIAASGTKYSGNLAGIGLDDRLFPKSIISLYEDILDSIAKMAAPSVYATWIRDSTSGYIYPVRTGDNVGIGTSSPTSRLQIIGIDSAKYSVVEINNSRLSSDTRANIGFGNDVLGSTTSGLHNSGLGFEVFKELSEGQQNTAMGYMAMRNGRFGIGNTAFGWQSLKEVDSASSTNCAFGISTLENLKRGACNTAIGAGALQHQTIALDNTAVGSNAGIGIITGEANTMLGTFSGQYTSVGHRNVAVGFHALDSNTTGQYNVAVGSYSGGRSKSISGIVSIGAFANYNQMNTDGDGEANTAVGFYALFGGISGYGTGQSNGAFGWKSLYSNSTGDYNYAFGSEALYANTTGGNNIAIGRQSLKTNIAGVNNIAIGYQASLLGTGDENVAIGTTALKMSTASNLVAIGGYCLDANTTGTKNTAIGYNSLTANTNTSDNSAFGYECLKNNIAAENTAFGSFSMTGSSGNSTGGSNSAFGYGSLFAIRAGTGNTSLGYMSMFTNQSGSNNVAIGKKALYLNLSGSGNISIGQGSGYNETGSYKSYWAADSTSWANGMASGSKLLLYADMSNAAKSNHFMNIFAKLSIGAAKAPAYMLDVTGTGYFSDDLTLDDNLAFVGAGTISTTGNGTMTLDVGTGKVDVTGAVNITTSCTVGTFVKLTPTADPPGSPTAGMIYSDTDGHIYHYDGSNWDQLDN